MCAHLEYTDRRSSPQLQRDGGNLWGLLECSGGQSGSQRIRRICVCTRPSEIVLLFVGSHGPTMNVYIAKWLSLPALRTAHAYDYGPAHRQTGSRKQEQEASTRHSRSRHGDEQTDGRTGGWKEGRKRPSLSVQTLTEMQTGRSEKKKKLIDKKKLQIRICTKIWKLFCFFDL